MPDSNIVLIVDDSPETLRLLGDLLAAEGYQVRPADSGALALAYAATTTPDLVLLDVRMPGMDGFEVCRRLKNTPATRNVPVLFLSGASETDDRSKGFELGAVDFIPKPFEQHELLARVRTHLELARLRSQLERRVVEKTLDLEVANAQLRVEIAEREKAEAALRASEELLARAQEIAHVGSWELNLATNRLTWSEEAFHIFGVSPPAGHLTYGAFLDRVHPEDRSTVDAEFTKSVREGADDFEIEHRIIRSDTAETRVVHHKCLHLRDTSGLPLRSVGVIQDITERKQAESALAQLKAQAFQIQKQESLSLMAGSIAHHFNNRLQSVMASLEVLTQLPRGVDPAKFLALAKQAVEKAAEVSRQLLVYLGQTSREQVPQHLAGLCREGLRQIQRTLPEGVTLETEFPEPGPVVSANATEVIQVLTHLVANAVDAMGSAGGCLRLSLHTRPATELPSTHRFPIGWQPQGSDFAVLAVADSGCGIAEADIEKLFDPFFSTKFTGRGLGLPVVLGIVQAHGGAITVESREHMSSVFNLIFPVSMEAVPCRPGTDIQAPKPEVAGTILLVDDDELLLMATRALIEILGFAVLTARGGAEAVELFRQHGGEIRCVITDLTMPRMDGWETLTALRQIEPTLPAILASGYDQLQVLATDHPDRPQAFLGKPFDLQQLSDALGQALGSPSHET